MNQRNSLWNFPFSVLVVVSSLSLLCGSNEEEDERDIYSVVGTWKREMDHFCGTRVRTGPEWLSFGVPFWCILHRWFGFDRTTVVHVCEVSLQSTRLVRSGTLMKRGRWDYDSLYPQLFFFFTMLSWPSDALWPFPGPTFFLFHKCCFLHSFYIVVQIKNKRSPIIQFHFLRKKFIDYSLIYGLKFLWIFS